MYKVYSDISGQHTRIKFCAWAYYLVHGGKRFAGRGFFRGKDTMRAELLCMALALRRIPKGSQVQIFTDINNIEHLMSLPLPPRYVKILKHYMRDLQCKFVKVQKVKPRSRWLYNRCHLVTNSLREARLENYLSAMLEIFPLTLYVEDDWTTDKEKLRRRNRLVDKRRHAKAKTAGAIT